MSENSGAEPGNRPIGRRMLLGAAGASVLGILFGARIQDRLQQLLLPITLHDPTGLSDLLPVAGRFRIYSVTRHLPSRSAADYRCRSTASCTSPVTLSYDQIRDDLPQADACTATSSA